MALSSIDPRLISVDILVNGVTKTYTAEGFEPLNIKATGTKYANALQNEATITLTNLDKATQDYLLSETTPFNLSNSAKTITLKAGRESYGTAVLYTGNIVSSSVTQPPDIGIILKCLTGNFLKTNVISRNQPGQATLSRISNQIAQDTNTVLNFQATDKNISNYNYTGSSLGQVQLLNSMGGVNAFIDGNTLVVKDALIPIKNTTRILSAETGLIGIPEFTEQGLRVTYLLDNKTVIGGGLQITSTVYPAINGNYVIYKLGFNITAREVPFYYIAEAARISGI